MGTDVSASVTAATESAAYYATDATTHVCGQEQIFSPITVRKGGGGGDFGFETPAGGGSGPFDGHVGATSMYLSPYFSQIGGDDGTMFMEETDFHLVANDAGVEINLRKTPRRNISRVQTTGMRGPLMISGWGTDLADRPVPQGKTVFEFETDAIGDRTKWKTGPVNLMWDYQRKVWSGGPQILMGTAQGKIEAPRSPCSPTSFKMNVYRIDQQQGGEDANCHLEETISVHNFDPSLSQEEVNGYVWVVAVRLNYKWVPIWVGCPEKKDYETIDPDTGKVKFEKAGTCYCDPDDPGEEDPDPADPNDPGDDNPGDVNPAVDPPDFDNDGDI
jgi:hypothetical protein